MGAQFCESDKQEMTSGTVEFLQYKYNSYHSCKIGYEEYKCVGFLVLIQDRADYYHVKKTYSEVRIIKPYSAVITLLGDYSFFKLPIINIGCRVHFHDLSLNLVSSRSPLNGENIR